MADDLDDAGTLISQHDGIDNHPHGKLIRTIFRFLLVLRARVNNLDDRLKALEPPR